MEVVRELWMPCSFEMDTCLEQPVYLAVENEVYWEHLQLRLLA